MLNEKIVISNNEYQEIVKKEADVYWKKVFAITEAEKKNMDQLKKQYWSEFNNILNQYKIEDFNPGLRNKHLNKFIEAYCNNNKATEEYTRYEGNIPSNYITIEGCKTIYNTGYNQYLTCEDDLTIIEYCEGDITILTYNNLGGYEDQLKKAEEFYRNN